MWPTTNTPDLMKWFTICPAGTTYAAGGYCVPTGSGQTLNPGNANNFPSYTVNVSACDPLKLSIMGQCIPFWAIGAAVLGLILVVGK